MALPENTPIHTPYFELTDEQSDQVETSLELASAAYKNGKQGFVIAQIESVVCVGGETATCCQFGFVPNSKAKLIKMILNNPPLFYIQDKLTNTWWAEDGLTHDVKHARIFTKEEALRFSVKSTDVLWPKAYVDALPVLPITMENAHWQLAEKESNNAEKN